MRRKIAVGVNELAALRWICERTGIYDESAEGRKHTRALAKLLEKAEKSHAPPPRTAEYATFGELEKTLLDTAGKSVLKLAPLTAREYVIHGRDIEERRVTVDQMRTVGVWLRKQMWLKERNWRPTLLDVLKHWGAWYSRAVHEQPRIQAPVLLGEEPEGEPAEE